MENRNISLTQAIFSPASAAEASSTTPSALEIDGKSSEAAELLAFEAFPINDTIMSEPQNQGYETSKDFPGHLPPATSSHSAQCQSLADTEVPNQLFFDPADEVPVLLSIKFLYGYWRGNIYYHYFFPPPPVWRFPKHGRFEISNFSLFAVDETQTKKSLLDRDAEGVFNLVKESVKITYGNDSARIGLGPGRWLGFITDYNGSEVCFSYPSIPIMRSLKI